MSLPDDFVFSQSSLQDYVDCPRRFELRYIDKVRYPALEAQPALEHEEHMQQGAKFHTMVQQLFVGVPADALAQSVADDPILSEWWSRFLTQWEDIKEQAIGAEMTLQTVIAGYRLIAKYDLIVKAGDGRMVIYDWKTSRNASRQSTLLERMQTVVYRYVMAQAGDHLHDKQSIQADDVRMVYWFVAQDGYEIVFDYSAEQMQQDEATLVQLIQDIVSANLFPLTSDTKKCRFCTYRSLCGRGEEAGQWQTMSLDDDDIDDVHLDDDADFDFDQIAEIEF